MQKLTLLFLILLGSISSLQANDYFWVGGGGNWSDYANHWATTSGGSSFHTAVPGPGDDVYFDANSFSAAGQKVILDVVTQCRDLNWTGATHTPILEPSLSSSLLECNIYGSVTLIPAMILNLNNVNSQEFIFHGTGTHSLTFANHNLTAFGGAFTELIFTGNGTYTLMDTVKAGTVNLENGTLNTNDQYLDLMNFFSWTNFTRTLNLGNSTVKVRSGSVQIGSNAFTLIPGTSTFDLHSAQFDGGGMTYYDLHLHAPTGSWGDIYAQNTFHNLISDCHKMRMYDSQTVTDTFELVFTGGTLSISSGKTLDIGGELIINGSCTGNKTLQCLNPSGLATVSKAGGTVNLNFVNLENVQAVGGATFNANASIPVGVTTGWNISQNGGVNYYWIGGSGNWEDSTRWSFLNCRDEPSYCLPTLNDNVFFGECSFLWPGQIFEITGHATCHDLTWANIHNNPTWTGFGDLDISGSLVLDTGMTTDFSQGVQFNINFVSNDPEIIDPRGHRMAEPTGSVFVTFDGNGSWDLLDSLYTSEIYLNKGTLHTNGHNLQALFLNSWILQPRNLDLADSEVRLYQGMQLDDQNLTCDADSATIIMQGHSSLYMETGGVNFMKMIARGGIGWSSAEFYPYGSTIDTFVVEDTFKITLNDEMTILHQANFQGPGLRLLFGTSAVLKLPGEIHFNGNPQLLVSLKSINPQFPGAVYRPTDSLCFEYLEIDQVHGTGNAYWGAGLGCMDLGGNTGWHFSPNISCAVLVSETEEALTNPIPIVYPNPVYQGESLRIEFSQPGEITCDLYDLSGKLLGGTKFHGNSGNLFTAGLARGSYLLKIRGSRGVSVHKVLVE
ncbi:MAG: T9SS type A sorting domain-containing protein [Bacteroidia bacterium]|nr:T9SS type A sorting domain-containing protein [Bacteroidia bacterium]